MRDKGIVPYRICSDTWWMYLLLKAEKGNHDITTQKPKKKSDKQIYNILSDLSHFSRQRMKTPNKAAKLFLVFLCNI